jgi:hypothetical protein
VGRRKPSRHGKFSFLEVALKTIKSGTNALLSSIGVLSSNCNKNNVQYLPPIVNGYVIQFMALRRKKLTFVNDKTKHLKRENRGYEADSHNVLPARIFILTLYIVNRVRGAKGQTPRYEVEGWCEAILHEKSGDYNCKNHKNR